MLARARSLARAKLEMAFSNAVCCSAARFGALKALKWRFKFDDLSPSEAPAFRVATSFCEIRLLPPPLNDFDEKSVR